MRKIVCLHCRETVHVPEDLAQAHCVRCGQVLALPEPTASEAHVTSLADRGINSDDALEPAPDTERNRDRDERPRLAWEEFRATSAALQRELTELAMRPLPDLRRAPLRAPPEKAFAKAKELGDALATLAVPGENMEINLMAGWSLIIGGFLFAGYFTFPMIGFGRISVTWLAATALGLTGVCFGVWYAYGRHPILAVTLWLFDKGILWQRGREIGVRSWEDVLSFHVNSSTAPPLSWLVLREDFQVVLSADRAPEVMQVIEFIEIKVTAAQFLPRLRAIFEGERVPFGVVTLDRAGFTSPRFFAPWSKVVRVVADHERLYVDLKNRESWHQIRYGEVSFSLLLKAISHVMIEEVEGE